MSGGETRIGPAVTVRGKIAGRGSLSISGRLQGDCTIEGPVCLEPGSRMEGRLSGRRVEVAGRLVGALVAGESAVVTVTGRIEGDVNTPILSVAEGARINGIIAVGPLGAKGGATPAPGSN